jgi:hypothetical protein
MKRAAYGVSVLLHPLFMPLYTVWLAMRTDPLVAFLLPEEARTLTLAMVALMTIAFPLTSTLLLKRAGLIHDLELPTREERLGPYMMTLVYYVMGWYLLSRAPLDPAVSRMFIGAAVALGITSVITLRWKISAHMVGIGGLIGALAGLNTIHGPHLFPVIVIAVLLAGLLGTARLLSSDHTQGQVLTGALLGVACTYASVVLGWEG